MSYPKCEYNDVCSRPGKWGVEWYDKNMCQCGIIACSMHMMAYLLKQKAAGVTSFEVYATEEETDDEIAL